MVETMNKAFFSQRNASGDLFVTITADIVIDMDIYRSAAPQ